MGGLALWGNAWAAWPISPQLTRCRPNCSPTDCEQPESTDPMLSYAITHNVISNIIINQLNVVMVSRLMFCGWPSAEGLPVVSASRSA